MEFFFNKWAGKKVAFIGAGVTNRALVLLFAKAGALVTLCDTKSLQEFGDYGKEMEAAGVKFCLGKDYLKGIQGQEIIMRTPGVAYTTPEIQEEKAKGAVISSEMELFFEYCPCPIVAVTGSDGKTTTTSLIAAIYQQAGRKVHLGGNIGRALLPIVEEISPADVAVVELSSFQLISMKQSPHIAVVTNVTPNHLDHHKDMQEYIDAKRNILLWQTPQDVAVLGMENEISKGMAQDVKGECRFFSRLGKVENGACLNEENVLCLARDGVLEPVLPAEALKLRGLHNVENVLAAFGALMGEVPVEAMAQAAATFTGVAHRIEPVRQLRGVQWFNDSIATSPTRVIAGLRAFPQKMIVIAGGYDKNIPFAPMVPDILTKVKLLILLGPTAAKIEAAVKEDENYPASGLAILHAKNLEEAVALANQQAVAGDIVTLSPACASFDAYPNFEARGNYFKELVNHLM